MPSQPPPSNVLPRPQIHLRAGTPASVSKASQFAGLRDIAIMVFFRTCEPARARHTAACGLRSRSIPSARRYPSRHGLNSEHLPYILWPAAPLREHRCAHGPGGTGPEAWARSHSHARRRHGSSDSFTERAQAIADTITPVDVPAVDYALCQARASALQYPSPACPIAPHPLHSASTPPTSAVVRAAGVLNLHLAR